MNNRQTPLERLIAEKQRLKERSVDQERKLGKDFAYIQANAGSLLLSGLSALLFPGPKGESKGKQAAAPVPGAPQPALSLGLTDYLSIAKGLLPIAWEVAQPLLMSWGIKKTRKWIVSLFSRKKADSKVN